MNNFEKNIEQNNNENKSKITNIIKDQKKPANNFKHFYVYRYNP